MSTAQLFTGEKQTDLYAKFRPVYSDEVFETIKEFCAETSSSFDTAVDLGCGSGQSTLPLTKYFRKVVGMDVSEQQIARAPTDVSNLSFRVSRAEDLSAYENGSLDLVTIAQAFHWVDQSKFFKEVERTVKPGGSLVVYGYGLWELSHQKVFQYFYHIYGEVLGPYWVGGRKMVEEKYRTVSLPYPGWRRDDSLSLVKEVGLEDLIGYMGSWSAYHKYNMAHPGNNLVGEVRARMQELAGVSENEASEFKTRISWPVFMLMAHLPS
ncbi:putative methyltransferase DDB_G0268948 isoform X2 [Aplysia californica]|nr:putative methyltransferase DDB_G0268948 isoform X2 [Aplysia californica]XP_035828476.1 putative methyltransferase DDB_G0268948 isoform X2 [Aplysia californica]